MLKYLKLTMKNKPYNLEIEVKSGEEGATATLKNLKSRKSTILSESETEKILSAFENFDFPKANGKILESSLWALTYQFEGQDKKQIFGNKPFSSEFPEIFDSIKDIIYPENTTAIEKISLSIKDPITFEQEIILERKSGTLTIIENSVNDGCDVMPEKVKSERKYASKSLINSLLDALSAEVDTLILPRDPQGDDMTPFYKLKVTYSNKKEYVLSGPYNRTGVPDNFDEFIEKIRGTINDLSDERGFLDPAFLKCGPINDGVIYLSVSFGTDKTYYYKTTDRKLRAGQDVLVPIGDKGVLQSAKIMRVDYFDKENVPYPLEKVKSAIMRVKEKFDDTDDGRIDLKRFLCIYIPFLTAVSKRENILDWCENYKNTDDEDDEIGLLKLFEAMNREAYLCGIVYKNYREVLKKANITEGEVCDADEDFFEKLDERELTAAISFHFTLQNLNKEEFFQKSIVSGALLRLLLMLDILINR